MSSGTRDYSLAMSKVPLTVVVPALNEAEYLPRCPNSLRNQDVRFHAVSDNASEDEAATATCLADNDHSLSVTTSDQRRGPIEHFVSAGRWALETSDAKYLSFLAADDEWRCLGFRYAASWQVLGRYRAVGCKAAVGVRRIRADTDLLECAGKWSDSEATLPAKAIAYVRRYFRVNGDISRSIAWLYGANCIPEPAVFGLRIPQTIRGTARQLTIVRPRRGTR